MRWAYEPSRAVPHIIFGNTKAPGGQWIDNPVAASWDIEALSYGEMLSLPGYTFARFHEERYGKAPAPLTRPCRRKVADYYAAYPKAVGIEKVLKCGEIVAGIKRIEDDDNGYNFYITSHNLRCKHLVLASGIFSELIPAPPALAPLTSLSQKPPSNDISQAQASTPHKPILVIGSGFTAADIILSAPSTQKILHIYKWAPEARPSPLRACHRQAYPEYAGFYRKMRCAAESSLAKPRKGKKGGAECELIRSRDWETMYEGLPNYIVDGVEMTSNGATVTLKAADGTTIMREIGEFAYVVGRRGKLRYLSDEIRHELLDIHPDSPSITSPPQSETNSNDDDELITGQTLRSKASLDIEVAPSIFIIGSLTGDSLVRFAYGGCVAAAGKIVCDFEHEQNHTGSDIEAKDSRPLTSSSSSRWNSNVNINGRSVPGSKSVSVCGTSRPGSGAATPMMEGIIGHNDVPNFKVDEVPQSSFEEDIAADKSMSPPLEAQPSALSGSLKSQPHSHTQPPSQLQQQQSSSSRSNSTSQRRWTWQTATSELMRYLRVRA